MGEHAVVYGHPALVAAVNLRLTARLASAPGDRVRLDLLGLAHAEEISWPELRAYARAVRESWREYSLAPGPAGFGKVRGEDPAHVVKAALGEAAESLGAADPGGLTLRVESALPIGSGFGSSAAAAVGVIASYLIWRGAGLDLQRVERLALEVERRQHGMPSGVDGATVLHGGILWARKLADGSLEAEAVPPGSPLLGRLRVYDSGTPREPTGAVVAAVRARRDAQPARCDALLDRIEAATRAFRDELARPEEDPARVVGLIRECQACLEELGVVPEAVRDLVRKVEAEGGAAKISGAGSLSGPGAGSLLVYDPLPERVAGWSFLQPYPYYAVQLGASGLRREEVK